MSGLSLMAFQEAFAASLLSANRSSRPDGLADDAAERFRIYRNNMRHGLAEVLASAYPVVQRLVGKEFFLAMALEYIAGHPPRTRSLVLYGADLPRFIAGFPPAVPVPYLADVAQLERALLEARHARDAPQLPLTAITEAGEALARSRLLPHPATRLVESEFPVVDIWRANRHVDASATELRKARQGALVTRPRLETSVRTITPAESTFAKSLLAGNDLTTAHEDAAANDEAFDVTAAFRTLLSAGGFTGLLLPGAAAAGMSEGKD